MSQSVELRPSPGGGAGQSFLSLDDGPTSPSAPSSDLAAPRPSSPGVPPIQNDRPTNGSRDLYEVHEFGEVNARGDAESFPRMVGRSPNPSSHKARRRSTIESARHGLTSPDATLLAQPFPTNTGAASSAVPLVQGSTRSNSSVGARIGAFMSRSTKTSDAQTSARASKRSDPPAATHQQHEIENRPSTSASVSAQGPIPSEASGSLSLTSRFLRSKGSRQRLKDLGDPAAGVREAHDLVAAFGLRSEGSHRDDLNGQAQDRPNNALHIFPHGPEGSPMIPDFDPGYNDAWQSGASSLPSSQQNHLPDAGPSSLASGGRSSSVGFRTRGGRLGRLQYTKNEGLSFDALGRDTTGLLPKDSEARNQERSLSRVQQQEPFPGHGGPLGSASYGDREAWLLLQQQQQQQRVETDGRDWTRQRLLSSLQRDEYAAHRGVSAAIAGLGIEAGIEEESPTAALSSPLGGSYQRGFTRDSFRSASSHANGSSSGGRTGTSSQHTSASYQADAIPDGIGQAWTDERDGPYAYKPNTANAQLVEARAGSRTSVQDQYHNRFSKQALSDGSRYSRSSAQSRDTTGRGYGESSPSLGPLGSPQMAAQLQQLPSSAASGLHHRKQQPSSGPEARLSSKNWDTSTSGQDSAVASATVAASPPVGSLSDAAILAMGAVPGAAMDPSLSTSGVPLSSKNVLTIALQKAQSAVQLDGANHVAEAISAYRQAVRLLDEVMARIAPKPGRKSRPSREEERRRLRVIHDTYADRIRLLSLICAPEDSAEMLDGGDSSYDVLQDSADHTLDEGYRSEQGPTGPRPDPTDDGDQSFLFMTPVGDRHDTSTMDGFMSGRPGEASSSQAALETPDPDPDRSQGAMSVTDKQSEPEEVVADRNGNDAPHEAQSPTSAARPVSIQQKPPMQTKPDAEALKGEEPSDRSAALRAADAAGQGEAHVRTDSDASARSGRAKSNASSSFSFHTRSLGLDEESKRPATLFFDAADAATGAEEGQLEAAAGGRDRKHKVSLSSGVILPVEDELTHSVAASIKDRAVPFNLAQRPSLRAKGSMPLLRRSRDAIIKEDADPLAVQDRPSSADSPPDVTVERGAAVARANVATSAAAPSGREASFAQSKPAGRPRANTLAAKRAPSAFSTDPAISQRRARANPQPPSLPTASLETMTRTKSVDPADSREASLGSSSGHLPLSYSRQRAISQPGSRRPSIPASFLAANASVDSAPPVPKLALKMSDALADVSLTSEGSSTGHLAADTLSSAVDDLTLALRRLSGPPSAARPPTASQGPTSAAAAAAVEARNQGQVQGAAVAAETQHSALRDIFPSGLPSLASGIPSYATGSSNTALFPWLSIASKLPDPMLTPQLPSQPVLRPFHIMRLLLHSIHHGGYVTPRLYIPKGLWLQQGARLTSIESKVRALELISTGLEAVEKGGEPLLRRPINSIGLDTANGSKFAKHLDELDALMIEVQNSLAKKLGFLETVAGKKAATSFGMFGSKLTRSLDRMTNGKNLDSPVIYIEGLARLFARAQILDKHLVCLLRSQGALNVVPADTSATATGWPDAYASLPTELKGGIESRLRRSSEFFANVILAFVLRDVGVLLDKFAKRGSLVFTE
ncbi:hypothetical protein ACQY0O_004221 [Thecaphora frezii]